MRNSAHPTTPDTPKPLYRKSLCRIYLSSSMVLLGHLVPTKMASRPWSFCIRPILVTSLRNVGVFPCQRPLTAGLAAFPARARMDGDEKQHGDWASGRKNGLPSFAEVLSRRTRPPVDLFMFYIFLQREGAEDILDSVGYPAA
jgi:hypothetical protein